MCVFHSDGTVPLLSLGYMCARNGAWQKHADLYNPAKIPIILKEFKHKISVSKLDVRGGKKASDHIDILGNWEMMVCFLFYTHTYENPCYLFYLFLA
jgi:phospholipid:diacylglycerol acyltransferase